MSSFRRRLDRCRRFLSRHRRALAALCAGLAVLVTLPVVAPPPPTTTATVVARRLVVAGTPISPDDVRVVRLPGAAVPTGAARDTAAVVGRIAAGPIGAGEVVTRTRLVSSAWLAGLPTGEVAAPVRFADAESAQLLRVGDRIDVYAPSARGPVAEVVVASALVAGLPSTGDGTDEFGGVGSNVSHGPGSLPGGALAVLAVRPEEAARLTQQAARAPLSFTLVH